MKKQFFSKIVAVMLAVVMVVAMIPLTVVTPMAEEPIAAPAAVETDSLVSTLGGNYTYPLFNSGKTGAGQNQSGGNDSGNYNANTFTNGGYDIYARVNSNGSSPTTTIGRSFRIDAKVISVATLTINAYDVDESDGELDSIYLVDETTKKETRIGSLSGMNNQWNTTTLRIAPDMFEVGHTYHLKLTVSDANNSQSYTWWVYVRTVSIQMTTDGDVTEPVDKPVIKHHRFAASIDAKGVVSTELYLATNQWAEYNVEFAAVINMTQYGSFFTTACVDESGVTLKNDFRLDANAPHGAYQIHAIIKDMSGNVVTTYVVTAGYEFYTVTYDANGGSNNIPIDYNAYTASASVTVLFDYIPTKDGYNFLGWSSDPNAVVPDYTEFGVTNFPMGNADVTLYAVWEKVEAPVDPDVPVDPDPTPDPTPDFEADEWDGTVAGGFGGGSGSEADPYLIYTAEELAYFAQSIGYYAGCYIKLMANIDLKNINWTPIGNSGTSFCGSFDGNGYMISNLKIRNENARHTGFFATVADATIKNLIIIDADVYGYYATDPTMGGVLAGGATNSRIENCYVSGSVEVINEKTTQSGLCAAAGMLIGEANSSNIENCFAMGNVKATITKRWNAYAGGLVGDGSCNISNSYFMGDLVAQGIDGAYVGGIKGIPDGGGSISNCFAVGNFEAKCSGTPIVDGISNYFNEPPKVTNSYYYATLLKNGKEVSGTYGTSADLTNFANERWLSQTLGWDFQNVWCIMEGAPVLQIVAAQFKGGNPNPDVPDTPDVPVDPDPTPDPTPDFEADEWDGTIAGGFSAGSGTENDPYLIYTAEELAYLAQSVNSGNDYFGQYFKLMANIDLKDMEWTPIGKGILTNNYATSVSYSFRGHFDGNYHIVNDFNIEQNNTTYSGLFGSVESGSIRRLGVSNVDITLTAADYRAIAGALVGKLYNSTVENCFASDVDIVTSGKIATSGCLIGCAEIRSTVSDCYAFGGAASNGAAGVLIGATYGSGTAVTVNNCLAIGVAEFAGTKSDGNVCSAGIVGGDFAAVTIQRCVFIGSAGTGTIAGENGNNISNCYYALLEDCKVSKYQGTLIDENSYGESLFRNSLGWDLDTVWTMEGAYPKLRGFMDAGTPDNPDNPDVPDDPDPTPDPTPDFEADEWDGTVAGGFGGGSGSENDPYLIYTAEELAYLAQSVNNGNNYSGQHIKLMANIDLKNINWTPIGKSYAFRGIFDGNNKMILGLTIDSCETEAIGLFGYASSKGTVLKNFCVEANIYGTFNQSYYCGIGGVVAFLEGGRLENVAVIGNIDVSIDMEATTRVGLLVGHINDKNTYISNCFAVGSVKAYSTYEEHFVGGLIGFTNGGTVVNSYAIATIEGNGFIGGFTGVNGYDSYSSGTIRNCFAIADISSENYAGGFAAAATGVCENCFYDVVINKGKELSSVATMTDENNFLDQAYLMSAMNFDFDSVWMIDADSEYPLPVIASMKDFFYGAGTDDPDEPVDPDPDPTPDPTPDFEADEWDGTFVDNLVNGSGTESDPYLIYTAEELAYLAWETNKGTTFSGKYFKLMANIDLKNIEWAPIGCGILTDDTGKCGCAFKGNFDGNYHTVYNLTVTKNKTSYSGLFGTIENATIRNLGIENAKVSSQDDSNRIKNGALIGKAYCSTVENCFVFNVKVEAYAHISSAGCLIGNVDGLSTVVNCYAYGNAISNGHAAVLVGSSYSDLNVTNCYAVGEASFGGKEDSGAVVSAGIVGYDNSGTTIKIQNCFFVGVSEHGTIAGNGNASVSNCYYYLMDGSPSYLQGTLLNLAEVNEEWLIENLKWNFTTVWAFDEEWGPVLRGFNPFVGDPEDKPDVPDEPDEPEPPVCEHNYLENGRVEPTCYENGFIEYKCEHCGDVYTDSIAPAHKEGDWIIDKEATCNASGSKHTECEVCHEWIHTGYIPQLSHRYVGEVTQEVTCTTPGITTYTCQNCGDQYHTYIYSEHHYEVSEYVKATCTSDGWYTYTCQRCGDSYQEIIPGAHAYEAEIIKVATSEEEGLIRYTCHGCEDFYEKVIPMRQAAAILLIQDALPWNENANTVLLDKLVADGYITGWDMTTTRGLRAMDLTAYNVIYIANDQSSATYAQLAAFNEAIEQFVRAGGVVIYGACDQGWSGGLIDYALPGGVVKAKNYSNYNYIVSQDHDIVTGILTDGKAVTNALLYSTYCSHTYFEASSLPADATVILEDGRGNATLVEYTLGNGRVIASGLTWEYNYVRDMVNGTSFAKSIYDDLIVYAVTASDPCDHAFDEGEIVEPTCSENGYTLHTCAKCEATKKDNFTEKLEHVHGEWETVAEPSNTENGLKEKRCVNCKELLESEIIPMINAAIGRVESEDMQVIAGQEIEFFVTIENAALIKAISIKPIFDEAVFELVDAEWLVSAMLKSFDYDTMIGAAAWDTLTDANTKVFRFVLRAKQTADIGNVTCEMQIQNENGMLPVSVVGKNVSVIECPHAHFTHEQMNDTYHVCVCTVCGHTEIKEHHFGDDKTCDDCGYVIIVRGDLDGNDRVDSDDSIYLLMAIFFADDYALNQEVDFDGDGDVDSDDAIYLLMYTFYPNEYPLV